MRALLVITLTASFAYCTHAADIPEKNERQAAQTSLGGYNDSPLLPGGKWHVHDPGRPQPKVVEPKYDGKPVKAPGDAKVLFDGTGTDAFRNKTWKIVDGAMVVGKGSQKSIEEFGDMHLHVEWMIPADSIKGWSQKQGNSGVFLMDRYEIQILNCWANRTYPDGMTGAMYGQYPPLVNACRKPGEWQSYDIHFQAPVFKENKLVSPATVTVYFNNVLVHDNRSFIGQTTHKRLGTYRPHPPKAPIQLQAHGSPIHFRNIWVAPL